MVDLFCTPFVDLIQRMRLEFRNQQAIFDLPARKWWLPAADGSAPDGIDDARVHLATRRRTIVVALVREPPYRDGVAQAEEDPHQER